MRIAVSSGQLDAVQNAPSADMTAQREGKENAMGAVRQLNLGTRWVSLVVGISSMNGVVIPQKIQNSLLNQVEFVGEENDSNTILFDIQPNQKDGVIKLIEDHNLPINPYVVNLPR